MKKILALVLALTLLCCSALTLAETATAMMTLYVTDFMGMNPADMGIEMAITLYTDNTASFAQGEDALTGTWTEQEDGSVMADFGEDGGQILLVANEDGTVTGFDPASDMSITLSPEAPTAAEMPEAVAADDISAFDGTWTLSLISAFGYNLSVEAAMDQGLGEMLGASADNLDIVIDNGAVSVFGQEALPFTFADGALTFSLGDEELNLDQTVVLCDDGSLKYTMMGMDMYFIAK